LTTLKPSEQRAPPPKMASPPSTKGLIGPLERWIRAVPSPSEVTAASSFRHRAPFTVTSAAVYGAPPGKPLAQAGYA
jgi:hypothetical protein